MFIDQLHRFMLHSCVQLFW
uniref:Uncharacterized protein n=1 Tax=Anguilla anguilla TaxID=7936 RepID=A0A0E9T5N9_ANGAN